jgi:hypothetical protein
MAINILGATGQAPSQVVGSIGSKINEGRVETSPSIGGFESRINRDVKPVSDDPVIGGIEILSQPTSKKTGFFKNVILEAGYQLNKKDFAISVAKSMNKLGLSEQSISDYISSTDILALNKDKFKFGEEIDYDQIVKDYYDNQKNNREIVKQAKIDNLRNMPLAGSAVVLGEGIGTAISMPYINKTNEDINKGVQETNNNLLTQIRKERFAGNTDEAKRLTETFKQYNSGVSDAIIENFNYLEEITPGYKDIAIAGAELALYATLGYHGVRGGVTSPGTYKEVKDILSAANRAHKAQYFSNLTNIYGKGKFMTEISKVMYNAEKVIPSVLRNGLEGGTFMSLETAKQSDATHEDIRKAFQGGFLLSGGLTAGIWGAGEILGRVPMAINKFIDKVDDVANTLKKNPQYDNIVDLVYSTTHDEPTLKQRVGNILEKGVRQARQLERRFVSENIAIERIEDTYRDLKGSPLDPGERPYQAFSSADTTADFFSENNLKAFGKDINPHMAHRKEVIAYLDILDQIDRKLNGNKVPLDNILPGNNAKKMTDHLEVMLRGFDDQTRKDVLAIEAAYRKYSHTTLNTLVQSGLKSEGEVRAMLQAHPHYVPHDVIIDDIFSNTNIKRMSQSFNIPKKVLQEAQGSLKKIKDPLEAIGKIDITINRMAQRAEAVNTLIETEKKYKAMGAFILKQGQDVPDNFDTIHRFTNGITEEWAVPIDIAETIKQTGSLPGGEIWNYAAKATRPVKQMFTTYNPAFPAMNKIRDEFKILSTIEPIMDDFAYKYGMSDDVLKFTKDEIAIGYRKYVGYGANIFNEPGMKKSEAMIKELTKSGFARKVSSANPLKLVATVNEEVERSTRRKIMEDALNQGFDMQAAGMISKSSTLDFGRVGLWTKDLNKAIPFLNAGIQSIAAMPKAWASNPVFFARMTMLTAIYPEFVLEQHNSRFKSSGAVSEDLKKTHWVIITGETETKDPYNLNPITVPTMVVIPKGEWQAIASIPVRAILSKAKGVKKTEVLLDMIGASSPISTSPYHKESNLWATTLQQNPIMSTAVGLATNRNLYFDTDIVPPEKKEGPLSLQYTRGTPEYLKAASNALKDTGLNFSPAMLDFTINSLTGKFGRIASDAIDTIFGLAKGEDIKKALELQSLSGDIKTQIPILSDFYKEANQYYGPESEYNRKIREEEEDRLSYMKAPEKEKIGEVITKLSKFKSGDEAKSYMNSLNMSKEFYDKLVTTITSRTTVNEIKKTDSVFLRSLMIDRMLRGAENNEQRVELLKELIEKKIYTADVEKQILEFHK